VSSRLPLPTLLSQALVAITIELDNQFEQRVPHRTTRGDAAGGKQGPWLLSLAMWLNLLRLVGPDGTRAGDLENAGGNLAGMERWGWVRSTPQAAGERPTAQLRRDRIVHASAAGRLAASTWPGLLAEVERRWRARFGAERVRALRESLAAALRELDLELPEYLPVLGYGLRAKLPSFGLSRAGSDASLPTLLAQVLLAFTLEYERESQLALAISANVTRPLGAGPMALRELPRAAGISKEAIAMAVGFLERQGVVGLERDPVGRGKRVGLTAKGHVWTERDARLLADTEQAWLALARSGAIADLRAALEAIVGDPAAEPQPLWAGLEPYPGSWRASLPRPLTLPHYPTVLHRGGYPDGS